MLFPHVVDLHPGQRAKGQGLLDGKPRVVGVDMHFDHIIIRYHPDGLQVSLKLPLLPVPVLLFHIDDKFRAVAELDVRLFKGRTLCCLGDRLRRPAGSRFKIKIRLLAQKAVQTPFHHLHQPLSAGIHHACLLKDRQHLRRLAKDIVPVGNDLLGKLDDILRLRHQLHRLVRHPLCHRQNRTLLRLHDGLVGSLRSPDKGVGQCGGGNGLKGLDLLGKPTKQLGQDHAGVAPCAPKGARGDGLCQILHGRLFNGRHFPGSRHNGHGHIRARISVRHWEHVQFVNPFLFCFQPLGACQKGSLKSFCVNRIHTHQMLLLNQSL